MGSRTAHCEIECGTCHVPHDGFYTELATLIEELPCDQPDRRRFRFSYHANDEKEREAIAGQIERMVLDIVIDPARVAKP